MNNTRSKTLIRACQSVGAVLAGLLAVAVLSVGTDVVLHAAGMFPPWGQPVGGGVLLLATVYRTIYSVAGAYLTARLAPERPMSHALTLGGVGFVLSIAGAVGTWNRGPAFGPHWYPLALVALAVPQCWAGGALRRMQLRAGLKDAGEPARIRRA